MPSPPRQLFASTIGTARYLPPEIVSLILVFLNFRDLSRLALASKACWSVASPYLWLHVGKVDNLVNLTPAVAGRNTRSGDRGSWCKHYPVIESPVPVSLLRFDKVAVFVRSLSLYEQGRRIPLYLARPLVEAFVDGAIPRALLPSLESLSLGPQNWEQGHGSIGTGWFHDRHSLDFLGLFLSPTVKRLAVKCTHGGLEAERLRSLSPSITDLRLWLHRSFPSTIDVDDIWVHATIRSLVSWSSLSTLSIDAAFLTSSTVNLLGSVPALRSLEVVCAGRWSDDWELLEVEPHAFLRLTSLFIEEVRLQDAAYLVAQPGLMGRLKKLQLTTPEAAHSSSGICEFADCVGSLCQSAPALTHLTFRPFCMHDPAILQPLRSLDLTSLDLDGVEINTAVAPVLLTLSPGLSYLNVRLLQVPAVFLVDLAMQFRMLRFLSITLFITKNLKGEGLETPFTGPMCVRAGLIVQYGTKELARTNLREYMRRIWVNYTVIPYFSAE